MERERKKRQEWVSEKERPQADLTESKNVSDMAINVLTWMNEWKRKIKEINREAAQNLKSLAALINVSSTFVSLSLSFSLCVISVALSSHFHHFTSNSKCNTSTATVPCLSIFIFILLPIIWILLFICVYSSILNGSQTIQFGYSKSRKADVSNQTLMRITTMP